MTHRLFFSNETLESLKAKSQSLLAPFSSFAYKLHCVFKCYDSKFAQKGQSTEKKKHIKIF